MEFNSMISSSCQYNYTHMNSDKKMFGLQIYTYNNDRCGCVIIAELLCWIIPMKTSFM